MRCRGAPSEIRTPDQLVAFALELKRWHGFTTHKLKGGVFPPSYELECYRQLAEAVPDDRLRYDPNSVLPVDEAIRFGRSVEDLNNDYYGDPTRGLPGMRRVREAVRIPLATNSVIVDFEQLATNVKDPAADARGTHRPGTRRGPRSGPHAAIPGVLPGGQELHLRPGPSSPGLVYADPQ